MASILTVGGFLSMFTSTVVNVALGTIAAGFRAPLGSAQWVATGYLLALFAMPQRIGGITTIVLILSWSHVRTKSSTVD
ncbi:hypothetical protein [Amycolatopsis oliviviridis]